MVKGGGGGGCCTDTCGPRRWAKDFGNLDLPDVLLLLHRNALGINIVLYTMTTVFVLWMLANIVPGFALYDGTAGPTAYTHSGWWMVIQFFVLLLGEGVTRFSLHYSRSEGVVEKGIVDGINRMYWYLILVGLALVSHLIHLILMGLEVQMCDSTLCKDISWVFWATFALIAVHPFLLGWLMYRVMVFRANLEAAIGYDKLPTTVLGVPPSAPPQFQKESAQIGGRVKKSLKMLHHIK